MQQKSKQLYVNNSFVLPVLGQIQAQPYPLPQINSVEPKISEDNKLKQQHQIGLNPTFVHSYNSEFQIIIGGQNVYPLFQDLSKQYLIICSKDSFIIVKIQLKQDFPKQNQKIFLKSNIKLGTYRKIPLTQIPTAMKHSNNVIYFGYKSGKINSYDIIRKSFVVSCQHFLFPILQIQTSNENSIVAIDSAGNLKLLTFNHKTIMDKIIKTLIDVKQISVIYQNLKRDKIKKMFSNLINKKQQPQTQPNSAQNLKQLFGYGYEGFPYFYSKFALVSENIKAQINPVKLLVAVYRKNQLSMLMCDQNYKNCNQVILQEEVQVGMIQFGIGGFTKSNNTHLLLVASIQNRLQYYKGVQAENMYQWLLISQTLFQSNILDGKFISNNLLVVLTMNSIQICNANENSQLICNINIDKFSYIDFFNQEQKLDFDKRLINHNILKIIEDKNEFSLIQGKRLITGKVDSWKDYLQKYVNQYQFKHSMQIALKIYHQKLTLLADINQKQSIRNKEMKEFFQKITLTFISYEIKKQNCQTKNMLEQIIRFMVETDSCQYLFTTIYEAIQSYNLVQQFISVLQKYIENGKINFMSEQVLDLVVQHYQKLNKKDYLEILVMHFDLQIIEKSLLLTLCMKHQLYHSLIHICNQHKDYISPILKISGILITEPNKQNRSQLTEMLFYYIKECLIGHRTQYGNDQAYIQMLVQLINFLFIPNTIQMLAQIECKLLIKAVNMFFQTKILQYILQNQGKFFIKKNAYIDLKIFQEDYISQFTVYQKMIATLIFIMEKKSLQTQKNNEMLQYQVRKFLTYIILKNHFPFKSKYKRESISFFIKNPNLLTNQQKNQQIMIKANDVIQVNQNLKLVQKAYIQRIETEAQIIINGHLMRLLDSLLRSLQDQIKQKQIGLEEIYSQIISSQNNQLLSESKCYILHEQGKYGQVMQIYLKMKNKKIREKIFLYLDKNENEYQGVAKQFIKNIISLIYLNEERTFELLINLKDEFSHYETIISNLNQYPHLQLQYIERTIKQKISEDSEKKNKLLLLHLQIVVKHKFDLFQDYIQKIQYPLEEVYRVCEEKNSKNGKAYILIKSGRNMEGVLMLSDIMLQTCDKIFNIIAKKQQLEPERQQKLLKQLQKVLQTCQKEYKIDNQRGQQIWQRNVQKIFKHIRIQNIQSKTIPKKIKDILDFIVNSTLKTMFLQVSSDFFVQKFCKAFPNLPISVFLYAFGLIFDRLEFNNRLQLLQKQLLKKDEFRYYADIVRLRYRGNCAKQICSQCQNSTQQNQMLLTYNCGHIYHKDCIQNQMNSVDKKSNRNGTCYKCLNQVQSFIECSANIVQYLTKQNTQNQNNIIKIGKMKNFDSVYSSQYWEAYF